MTIDDDYKAQIVKEFIRQAKRFPPNVLENLEVPENRNRIREAAERDLRGIVRVRSELICVSFTSAMILIKRGAEALGPVPKSYSPQSAEEVVCVGLNKVPKPYSKIKRTHANPLDQFEFSQWIEFVYKAAVESGRDTERLCYPGVLCWSPVSNILFGWEGDDWVEREFEVAQVMLE